MATRKSSARKRPAEKSAKTTTTGSSHVWVGALWIALGVLLLAYLAYGTYVYLSGPTDALARGLTNLFDYPAATIKMPGYVWYFLLSFGMLVLLVLSFLKLLYLGISGKWHHNGKIAVIAFLFVAAAAGLSSVPPVSDSTVGYHAYLERYQSLKKFADKRKELSPQGGAQVESDDDLKSQALQQLILSDVIRQEATKYDVSVSGKQVDEAYKQYTERNQGEDNLKKQLKDFLGWTTEDFKQEIKVKLLEEKLNEKLASDDDVNKDARKRAEDFLAQVKSGTDFAEVAKQSDDPTAQAGGDQGEIKKGETDPSIESVAFNLEAGQTSDIIKTQRGYVIIKVEAKTADTVKLRQILVRTKTLSEFIPDELKNADIAVKVKGFFWDKTLNAVQPKNPQQPQVEGTPAPAVTAAPAAPAAQ